MFVKRTAELKSLEEQYASSESNLVILYGRKGTGKTSLLTEFISDKEDAYYYLGVECEGEMQLLRMNNQLVDSPSNGSEKLDFAELFYSLLQRHQQKSIIILDEFHFIMKNSPNFVDAINVIKTTNSSVMLILCSSSIRWVENDMIPCMGAFATYITSYLKLKEFTFMDFVNRFPNASTETCIYISAILGGVAEYLDYWKENLSTKENIEQIFLNKNSRLFQEPGQFLKSELREPAVYNTILSSLADGYWKLNDLHARTGYSRAKISVYLKNLIQLDFVEKLLPFDETGKENVQKGLYRIKDNYLSFWYRFVFPNLSELMQGKVSEVYELKIEPFLDEYVREYYSNVCMEFLKLMNQYQRMPETFLWWDRWYGKNGTIDVLAKAENGKTLVGKCIWEERVMDFYEYETLLSLSKEAGVTLDYCYLFSKKGFSEELYLFAKENDDIKLVSLNDL